VCLPITSRKLSSFVNALRPRALRAYLSLRAIASARWGPGRGAPVRAEAAPRRHVFPAGEHEGVRLRRDAASARSRRSAVDSVPARRRSCPSWAPSHQRDAGEDGARPASRGGGSSSTCLSGRRARRGGRLRRDAASARSRRSAADSVPARRRSCPSGVPIASPAMGARTGPPRFARRRLLVDMSFRPPSTKGGCPSWGPIASPAMGARTGPPRFARRRLLVDMSFRPPSTKGGCPSWGPIALPAIGARTGAPTSIRGVVRETRECRAR